ncbi:MAG: hypothetical protein ABEN55_22240, partial [Bradymonadaceae bacterium]
MSRMVEKLGTVMRVFSAAKGAVEIGMRATEVLSAPRAERSRQIVEECGAVGGGMVGGSIGAAAGGEIGAVAS